MKSQKEKWFAWYPVKVEDGWVWLKYVMRETRTETRPLIRCITDPEYLKKVVENIRKEQNPD